MDLLTELQYNREPISRVITEIGRSRPELLRGRVRHENIPNAVRLLELLGVRKPLLMSAERFIRYAVTTQPWIYCRFAIDIELYAQFGEHDLTWWCGTGRLKDREGIRAIGDLGLLPFPEEVIVEINVEPFLSQLLSYLERPVK